MHTKYCKQCGETKPLSEFYMARGVPRERCKVCAIERAKAQYRANPERAKALVCAARQADPRVRMAHDARARDHRKGLASDIEARQIDIPTHCPVLGIPMMTQAGRAVWGSPSIDHFDSTRGAVEGNWRIISHRANQLKGGHTVTTLAAYVSDVEAGRKMMRGRVTLDDYRAVLRYLVSTAPAVTF